MLRNATRALVALATVAGLGIGVAPAQAAPVPAVNVQRAAAPVAEPRLVEVQVLRRDRFDRLVFRFRGGVPDDVSARFVRVARFDNGDVARVPGRAILLLNFDPARARNFDRDLQRVDLDNVRAFRVVGDRRGVVRVAVGLRERAGVRVQELSNRIVIDVANNNDDDDDDDENARR